MVRTMSIARRISVIDASSVRNAACDEIVTFSICASGWSRLSGSAWNTSSPACAICPLRSASISAASSTSAPRAVLIEDHAALHARNACAVDDAAGFVVQREIERDHVGARQQLVELDDRAGRVVPPGAVPGDHLHADAARDAHDLAADAAEPDHAQRLALQLHAFERAPGAGAHRAVHAREPARAGEHQRDGVLGHRPVAVALDGVHGDAALLQRRHVHVARRPGAEEHDVLERAALRDHVGRHVGMVVDADLVAVDQARQLGGRHRLGIDHDRRVVGPVDPGEDRVELVVAVDEDRFHGRRFPGRYDMAKPAEMEGGHGRRISGQGRGHHRRQPRHRARDRGGVRARGRADRDRVVLGRQSRRCRAR